MFIIPIAFLVAAPLAGVVAAAIADHNLKNKGLSELERELLVDLEAAKASGTVSHLLSFATESAAFKRLANPMNSQHKKEAKIAQAFVIRRTNREIKNILQDPEKRKVFLESLNEGLKQSHE